MSFKCVCRSKKADKISAVVKDRWPTWKNAELASILLLYEGLNSFFLSFIIICFGYFIEIWSFENERSPEMW